MTHFLLQGDMTLWLIQVLASVTSGKQTPSAETFCLNKMQHVPGLMSSEALSTEVPLYLLIDWVKGFDYSMNM